MTRFEEHARVANSDEAASDKHAVTVAQARLVPRVDKINGFLESLGHQRLDINAVLAEHGARNLSQLLGGHDTVGIRVLRDDNLAQ